VAQFGIGAAEAALYCVDGDYWPNNPAIPN